MKRIKNLFKSDIREDYFKVDFINLSDEDLKKIAYEKYTETPNLCLKCFVEKYGYIGLVAILEYNSLNNIITPLEVLSILEIEILKIRTQSNLYKIFEKTY